MSTLPCDLVLLPDDSLCRTALDISAGLARHGALFTLKQGEFFPHMSLYMFELAIDEIDQIAAVMNTVAQDFSPILAEATNYSFGEGYAAGYIDPEYKLTDRLRSLQQVIVEKVNPLRTGMRQKDIAKMQDATGLKLKNLQTYGYPAIGDLFRPHMTLTRLGKDAPEAAASLPDISHFTGTFDSLGLFEMGDNGTCIKQLARVKLVG